MDRSADLYSAPGDQVPPPAAARAPLTQVAATSGADVPAGKRAADSAEVILRLVEDRDRIAQGVNDVLIRRLFAAGLDLESALELMGEHRATPRVCHAITELDQAIRDLRESIFEVR
jgi:signal transduction histidine kinase